jgi:tetratricopeptide (TPR) repeat protein
VLRVRGKVLTETLEVWECESCRVEVASKLATVQVDACTGLELSFEQLSFFDRVMSAGLRGGQLRFGDTPERDVAIDFDAECAARPGEVLNEKTDQLITWKVGEDVRTELIIRLCNDFPTTEREVRAFEERTRMQHDKLDEVVDGMLGSSIGQNMTSAEREQMKTMFQKQEDQRSAAKVEAEQTAQGRHAARVVFRKNQGNEAFKENNYQQAAVHYTEALTLDETQHAIYSNRAACFLKLGRYQQAREDAEACIKLEPTFAKGHFRLALALQAEEKYGEACAAFGKVLELEPNNKDAKSGLGVAQMQAERQRRAQAS